MSRATEVVGAAGALTAAVAALLQGLGLGSAAVTIPAGCAGIVVAGAVVFLKTLAWRKEDRVARETGASRLNAAVRIPVGRVSNAPASRLGVRLAAPHVLAADESGGAELDYIRRSIDGDLDELLRLAIDGPGARLVTVVGPARSGKSRALLEALRRGPLASAWLVAPKTRADISTIVGSGLLQRDDGEPVVLWLDQLERYVRVETDGFDVTQLDALVAAPNPVIVAATRGAVTLTSAPDGFEATALEELVQREASVVLGPELTGELERAALAARPAALRERIAAGGIPAISAGDEMLETMRTRQHPRSPRALGDPGWALLRAAIDATLAGVRDPLSDALLRELFACYFPSPAQYDAARAWASQELYTGIAMLADTASGSIVDDYLVRADTSAGPRYAEPSIWQTLVERATPESTILLARTAIREGLETSSKPESAAATARGVAASRAAIGHGFSAGWVLLGMALMQSDPAGADRAFREAIAGGQRGGWGGLIAIHFWPAIHEDDASHQRTAERVLRRAVLHDYWDAWHPLGWLLKHQGREADAELAFREAVRTGTESARIGLVSVLLTDADRDLETAEIATEGIANGNPDLWGAISLIYARRGGTGDTVEDAHRNALAAGHTAANVYLAEALCRRGGRDPDAETAYRAAIAAGITEAWVNLAALLAGQDGRADDAAKACDHAISEGHTYAWLIRAMLAATDGRAEDAQRAVEIATAAGHSPEDPVTIPVSMSFKGSVNTVIQTTWTSPRLDAQDATGDHVAP